jgi:type II secretory pathway pseudopilin PulG
MRERMEENKNLPLLPHFSLNTKMRGWGVKGVGGRLMPPPAPFRRDLGFTYMELMITIIIFATLTAISYPVYRKFVLGAKTSEVKVNIESIKTLEEAYKTEVGVYLLAGPSTINGDNAVGPTPGVYGPGPDNNSNQVPDFEEIGFVPTGKVYFTYMVVTGNNGSSMAIDAKGDLDGDEINVYFTIITDGTTAGGQSHYTPSQPYEIVKSGDDF